jgi:predicted dehydrogenase
VVDDFDSVLASDVTGVVLATPAPTHFGLARRALEAGKDVFVEKPLALHYAEGAELVRLAEREGRILMVGHVLEYHPAIVELLRLVRSGELGRLQYVYSNRLSFGKVRREENILWSFAPHDIAVVLRLLGELPYQVSAAGGSYLQPNIADVTVTNLLFNNGVRAHIHVSWLHPFKEQRLVVIGDRRMASFDDVNKQLLVYDQRVDIDRSGGEPVAVKRAGEPVAVADTEPLRLECQAFLDAMASRRPPLTDGASGARVLQVLQAAQRSLITNGEPVILPEFSSLAPALAVGA